jgi:hypothetical protein
MKRPVFCQVTYRRIDRQALPLYFIRRMGNVGIVPLIRSHDASWRWAANFRKPITLPPPPRGGASDTPSILRWVGPEAIWMIWGGDKTLCPDGNWKTLYIPIPNPFTTPIMLSRLSATLHKDKLCKCNNICVNINFMSTSHLKCISHQHIHSIYDPAFKFYQKKLHTCIILFHECSHIYVNVTTSGTRVSV